MATTNETKDTTYNGWTNYETWCVNLWMSNDEGTYEFWHDTAREIVEEHTDKAEAARVLADRLENDHEEHAHEAITAATVFADLLTAALDEVNWHEIATSLIEEVLS